MKKAAKKAVTPSVEKPSAPVSLGTKRVCPKCSTRFYDFGKTEINCPKCNAHIDPVDLDPAARYQAAKKAIKAAEAAEAAQPAEPVVAVGSDDIIEDTDDLGGDDDEVVEEIVEADDEDEF